jgi:radical SAM-linked protein
MAVWYAVAGEVRFLSHRDTMRFWQRALTRAESPVSFSQGFNPHMRLTLPLPRSVGMASRMELLVLEMTEFRTPEELISALSGQLPEGFEILEAGVLPGKLKPHPSWVRYQIHLSEQADRDRISQRLQQYEQASSVPVYRRRRGRHPERTVELKQVITELTYQADGLYCTLDVAGQVTARLDEVREILGISAPDFVSWVERIAVGYVEDLKFTN